MRLLSQSRRQSTVLLTGPGFSSALLTWNPSPGYTHLCASALHSHWHLYKPSSDLWKEHSIYPARPTSCGDHSSLSCFCLCLESKPVMLRGNSGFWLFLLQLSQPSDPKSWQPSWDFFLFLFTQIRTWHVLIFGFFFSFSVERTWTWDRDIPACVQSWVIGFSPIK